MIRDVKTYFQTVASRLSNAFVVEEFDTERELEFWSLAAEHVSREEPPRYTDIVDWMDLLCRAPIHFVYKLDRSGKLSLHRRHIQPSNIGALPEGEGESSEEGRQKQLQEIERQLDRIENRIAMREEFYHSGISSHSIGKCEHLPLYQGDEFWGIYCVGPYVKIPEVMEAKLSIVARLLSGWFVELEKLEKRTERNYESKIVETVGGLGTGTLNLDRIGNLMLEYLVTLRGARFGGIMEFGKSTLTFLAHTGLSEEQVKWISEQAGSDKTPDRVEETLKDLPGKIEMEGVAQVALHRLTFGSNHGWIFLGITGETGAQQSPVENRISDTLSDLLEYRNQNMKISFTLIDTYYAMLRNMEKEREQTYYHTPRMIALAEKYAEFFGSDQQETRQLVLTAKLHDVGYIVTRQLGERLTVGADLEHPVIGSMIVESLPLHSNVKEGIKTHHEWVDGSGTPDGVEGEEISWTGKIIGLLEFVTEFIESNRNDDSRSDEEWVATLSEAIIERADNQFDMVLVPTAIEMIQSLGWAACCRLGMEDEDHKS